MQFLIEKNKNTISFLLFDEYVSNSKKIPSNAWFLYRYSNKERKR